MLFRALIGISARRVTDGLVAQPILLNDVVLNNVEVVERWSFVIFFMVSKRPIVQLFLQ